MTRYVAVKTAGVIKVHLPDIDGNYYTLCGEDGDDPSAKVDSVAVPTPKGAKIDCVYCRHIWELCKTFTAKDFAPNKKHKDTADEGYKKVQRMLRAGEIV